MARLKKKYGSWSTNGKYEHQPRGGVEGKAVDSGFGSPTNLHRTKKNYNKVSAGAGVSAS